MKKSDQLKQERASKLDEINALIQTRKSEKRDFSEEETTKFDTLEGEIETLDGKIEREEKVEAAEARAAAQNAGTSVTGKKEGGEAAEKRSIYQRVSIAKALRTATSGIALDGAEAEMNAIAVEENRAAGVETPDNAKVSIPMSFLRATAQTVSEDAGAYGGALVVDQAPRVQMGFSPASILERLGATIWTGLTGGAIPLPVINDASFEWLTETGGITPQKQEIEGPTLSPKRLAGAVELSNRLLMQSSINVENTIRQKLLSGLNSALTAVAVNGGGSNQPTGVLANVNVGQGTGSAAQIPTKALVTELIKLVEESNASGRSLAFLGSPAMKYLLGITSLDSGSGRFLMEKSDELVGSRFFSSTHVPQLNDGADDNEVLIYGDWSELFVGQWGSISILTDPYSKSLNNSVRLVLNSHADVAIAQPGAFAVNKFFNAVPAGS